MKLHFTMLLILVLPSTWQLVGCSPSAHAKPKTLVACDADNPSLCFYVAEATYSVASLEKVKLVDSERTNYAIWMTIHYPTDAPGPRPVVIWNHGGLPSIAGASRSGNWGQHLAAAGYVVIHPSRTPIDDPTPYLSECTDNGFPDPNDCILWVTHFLFGPKNTQYLIDHLHDIEAMDPALSGYLDPEKIVVAGHSAGTSVVLANAGAWQQWLESGPRYAQRSNEPIAFLASGVQGPMYAGFLSGFQSPGAFPTQEHSFAAIERPFMFITGVGDETGEPPEARTTAWWTSVPGNKYLLWDTQYEAKHETMDIQLCDTPLQQDHCAWIASAGLAFLDAVVQQREQAKQWLQSDALAILSTGALEMHYR